MSQGIDPRRLAKLIHIQLIGAKEKPMSAYEALTELSTLLADYVDIEYPEYGEQFLRICKHGLKEPFFESRERCG